MSLYLSRRLQSLYETYKSTLVLIFQLQTFSPALPESDRLDLAAQIHDSLKSQEETLALLRQEIDLPFTSSPSSRYSSTTNSTPITDTESERNADLILRLTEDLKTARARFRRAQLTAKKAADDAKRKEREALFRRNKDLVNGDDGTEARPGSRLSQRGQQQEKLTQEEIARNASDDVTRALRRAHDLLSANLSQSLFAQQTLDESQDALKGLSESYGGTTDLLKASRGLVGQLVRSNKSDSWYLQTAFYIMVGTLGWLVFRRLLYGPLWWLVFLPLRLGWKGAMLLVGGGPLVSPSSGAVSSRTGLKGVPTNQPGVVWKSIGLPAKGGGWGEPMVPPAAEERPVEVEKKEEDEMMVEKIGQIVDESAERRVDIDNLSEEERRRQEEQPRNPKKRMMEVGVDSGGKDEL